MQPPTVYAFMHPFASYVLRNYYRATGWNEDNSYANLTRSSNALLDFTVPRGLYLSVSKAPNQIFNTTYSMTALPSLNGSIGYIFTSCPLDLKTSKDIRFKDTIEHFRVYDQPRRPEAKEQEWLGGERVDKRDYLLYGRLYLPTGRLDALYSYRISPTLQAVIAGISDPPISMISGTHVTHSDLSNVMLNLQHDVGKWCTEYTWSAEDGMWGVRALHNFGRLGMSSNLADMNIPPQTGLKRVDEEEPVEGGLKGRVSVGAELYFSAKERSAGVSTGIRFTTLPETVSASNQVPTFINGRPIPIQPPTTMTALFNPMLGHISGAYSARVSRDLAVASRFDFNVYSYESEWTVGAEWWMRQSVAANNETVTDFQILDNIIGVVKARASTTNSISLMWEGRLRNVLVSLGVVSDFANRSRPIKAIGVDISYFSSN